MTVQAKIEQLLTDALSPEFLQVDNESGQHNVAPGSESHFRVVIVTDQFQGQRLIQRHQWVNRVLADVLSYDIHALALHTYTDAEWKLKQDKLPVSPDCLGGSAKV
jgi:BolA protein